jgi:UDP-N-acetylmuramate: L-alanyl-gamma-D-glutamyl-meso-diaminopimelate ligase
MLKSNAHVHFIGICGTAMASLAGLFKSLGYQVTGSDQNVYPPMSTQLRDLGITIQEGYKKENLQPRPDLVVVGNVVSRTNEEVQALLATDIPYTSLPKAMGEYAIAENHSIVVAGTHGKTTTTSMMVKVADQCGKKPGFMIGGIPVDYGRSFRLAEGSFFVIEGDEYDTAFFDKVPKFIHYKPKSVILTSIEFDHADIYKDLDAVKAAFQMLIDRIPADGLLIAWAEGENVRELAEKAKCKVVYYGVNEGDYRVSRRAIVDGRNHFSVDYRGTNLADIALKLPGEHNALNAMAVFALARELKWDLPQILQGLANFQGVKRRQEVIGTPSGITLIEDFAHHPTAVKVTIDAVREKYLANSTGRLFCLFEPRSATSRRRIFQRDYVKAFDAADIVMIAKAYDQTKIAEEDRFSTAELARDLLSSGQTAAEFDHVQDIVTEVRKDAQKGDVILIMSNGGFGGIYQKLNEALK